MARIKISTALVALAGALLMAAAADAARAGPASGGAPAAPRSLRRSLLGGEAWVDSSTAQTLSMDEAQRGINAATLYGGVSGTMWATSNGQQSAVMTNNAGRGYGGWYYGWGNDRWGRK